MIDIATQAEVFLREAGYQTWVWTGASPPVTGFENPTIVGFLYVFDTAEDLLAKWEGSQARVLARHAVPLRAAGTKAWNVYSVFLTSEHAPALRRDVERLEEDFTLTRKIARTAIQVSEDLDHALMPLAPIKAQPILKNANIEDRLRARAKDLSPPALEAFLGTASAADVADMLSDRP
jgi:hypothetical protein